MISAWLNSTVNVQRRPANPSRNALNEPNYGTEASYPIVYPNLDVRIEYDTQQFVFAEGGLRVNPEYRTTYMFVDDISSENGQEIKDRKSVV